MDSVYKSKTASGRFHYAQKYNHCLLDRNLSDLQMLTDDKRSHVMKGLSALAKFLGVYEDWKRLIKDYGLKWMGKSSDEIVIDRLTKITNVDEVFEWIKDVKVARPKLACFMDFMAITGLRLVEAVESCNLIIKLAKEGRLSEYYSVERGTLEHYKFKALFIRRTKKAFISFVPEDSICEKYKPKIKGPLDKYI